jgi:hypothetical protein
MMPSEHNDLSAHSGWDSTELDRWLANIRYWVRANRGTNALANSKYGGIELKQAAAVADVAGRARLTI